MDATPTRWVTDTPDGHSEAFVERFRSLERGGADVVGEARLMDAMLARGSRVLDAGCGAGRVGAHLQRAGHTVVGVDADPVLVEAAREDHRGSTWLVADLATLDLPAQGIADRFDACVCAGNVMPYVAPGTETDVLRRIAAHLVPDGFAVVGFGTGRGYDLADFDRHLAAAGFALEHRFATWDLRPWRAGGDFAVSVLRRPTS